MLRLLILFALAAASLQAIAAPAEAERPNGVLLVARPEMQDPNFRQTVVLVTQHRDRDTLGVILNRPSQVTLATLFPSKQALKGRGDLVYLGGPVAPQVLVFVFESRDPLVGSLHVLDDVHMSVSPKLLGELLDRPKLPERFRAYAGYSGWMPGQLNMEVHRRDWFIVRADPDIIFREDPKGMWEEMVKKATTKTTGTPFRLHPAAFGRP